MIFKNKTIRRLDQMLEEGIRGEFRESRYDESQLSRLESKWKQFLESSSISREALEKEKENIQGLISDISHQTKTPLANIRLYGELLVERLEVSARKEEEVLARQIVNQTERLEFLIQSLTKLSRLESNIFTVHPTEQKIYVLMEEARQEILPKAGARGITVKMDCPREISASYDRKWTSEALYNILDNAVKYSPQGSEVVLSAREYEFYADVSVTDHGIGMPEEEIPRIFGRFYRSERVQQEEGVGLGLYLAREILRKEDGYIRVESRESAGSTFHMFLRKETASRNKNIAEGSLL